MVRQLLGFNSFASICILVLFIIAAEAYPLTLIDLTAEDGPIENLTAFLFLASALIFLWNARRAQLNQSQDGSYAVFFLMAWCVLLIVFAGEEISWGQRIFGFATPEAIDRVNKQNEFNIHNISYFDSLGGTGTYVSILMLTVGLVLPILDRFVPLIRKIGVPVPSPACSILFTGAYLYGLYFKLIPAKFEPDLQLVYFYRAVEVRELILSIATLCFATDMLRSRSNAP